MRSPLTPKMTYLALIIGALTLSACGVKGKLKTPPPLFGGALVGEQPAEPEADPFEPDPYDVDLLEGEPVPENEPPAIEIRPLEEPDS